MSISGKPNATKASMANINKLRCFYCSKDFVREAMAKNQFLDATPLHPMHSVFIQCSCCHSCFCSLCIQKLYAYATHEAQQDVLLQELKHMACTIMFPRLLAFIVVSANRSKKSTGWIHWIRARSSRIHYWYIASLHDGLYIPTQVTGSWSHRYP